MTDNFDNVPLADQETHEGIRRLLEDRKVGEYQLPIAVVAPHVDMTAMLLAQEAARHAPLVILGGEPGIGKSWHREMMEESKLRIIELAAGVREVRYSPAYALLDEDKGKPEWQKRRDASARAKAGLVARLKKGRR